MPKHKERCPNCGKLVVVPHHKHEVVCPKCKESFPLKTVHRPHHYHNPDSAVAF